MTLIGRIAIVIAVVILLIWGNWTRHNQREGYDKVTKALLLISPEQILRFRIYPRTGVPVGSFKDFDLSDRMITEFCQKLGDIYPYQYDHDTVMSEEYSWFIEIKTNAEILQISFHIPSEKGNIVVGELGEFIKGGGGAHYGYFQSRQLYQWYQTYSHRWLTPEGSPPAPQP